MTRFRDDHFSHRGRGLLLMGAVWVMVGVSVFTDSGSAVVFPLTLLEPELRATVWVATGVVAIVAAVRGASQERTKWAFAALLVPATFRALSYAVSWGLSLFTDGGTPGGWSSAIAWTLVVLFVLHEASTPVLPASLSPRLHGGQEGL